MGNQSKVPETPEQNRDVMYQVSLLQSLAYGDYCGSVTVKELKQHGDIGIGTFNRLNGELIMLDGEVYRATGDGCIEIVSDDETVPFCIVTYMGSDETKHLSDIPDYDAFCKQLDQMVDEKGINRFYMIRVDGMFRKVNVRSVYAQEEPYKRLAEVMEKDQTFFDYKDVEGTLVGLYCPPYMAGLNAVGWHFHFISKDKTKGGHVLGLDVDDAGLVRHDINGFQIQLPKTEKIDSFDFTVDQSDDIKRIETNKLH